MSTSQGPGIRWAAVALGAVAGYGLQLAAGFLVGYLYSPLAFSLSGFSSLLVGGYLAARLADRQELLHGTLTAVPFILVSEFLRLSGEMELARAMPQVVPRLNMAGLAVGDLVLLAGAAAGGWLAGLMATGRKES